MQQGGVSAAIDGNWEAAQDGPRPHLGASEVGKPCDRRLVYGFRHAVVKRHDGRLLRLFNRGHREEPSIVASLRRIGFEVREYAKRLTYHAASDSYATLDWDDVRSIEDGTVEDVTEYEHHVAMAKAAGVELKQWQFKDFGGHHAGSNDGIAINPSKNMRQFKLLPPDEPFLLEFKTYSLKSFRYMVENGGVAKAKPEHYIQMQIYMKRFGLARALYIAVCKNDDQMHDEVVLYDEAVAESATNRARAAVAARQLPPRLRNSPTWFECKFCDYRGPCHYGEPLAKSCRSCAHSAAVTDPPEGEERRWHCGKWCSLIPVDAVPKGCDAWEPITD